MEHEEGLCMSVNTTLYSCFVGTDRRKPANRFSASAFTLAYLCFYPNFQFSTTSAMKEPSVQADPCNRV